MSTPDAKKMRKGDIDDDTDEEDLLVDGGGANEGTMDDPNFLSPFF